MKFPFVACDLTKKEADIFKNHFAEHDGRLYFEGVWFRNQRIENKNKSGYKDETTKDRRYVHFYDAYEVKKEENKNHLTIADTYVYVSSTYKKAEIKKYKNKILKALKQASFKKIDKGIYQKDNVVVEMVDYKIHPKNEESKATFPKNYASLDVIYRTKGYNRKDVTERVWHLSTKMFRQLDEREEPTYINSIEEIKDFLPAQIEMGCGPSIEVGIPPLYEMHESYKVQSHEEDGKFYFREGDDLMVNLITKPEEMYKRFSYVPKVIIKATPTEVYDTFAKLYNKGIFRGTVLNNNFDRLVKRYEIPEFILRIYDKDRYLPKIQFDKEAKSLIVIGAHADRRQVQKQARAAGKKVIFIDPEGFYNEGGFEPYPIEGPKSGDFIYKTTFEKAMQELADIYLNKKEDEKQVKA